MRLAPGNKSYLVYLKYEDKERLNAIRNFILEQINNVDVRGFTSISDLKKDPDILKADLVILELHFNDKCLGLLEKDIKRIYHENLTTPLLFISDTDNFDQKKVLFLYDYPILIYDFIAKEFVESIVFTNRIKVLLNLRRLVRVSCNEAKHLHMNLWKLLDYSNIFALILDQNYHIKAINDHLAKTLGFLPNDLINEDWLKFLKNDDQDVIKYVLKQVLNDNGEYSEFSNDIIDIDQNIITVKWFNSLINHNYHWVFSVGIPVTINQPTLDEDIQSIRSYFKDILQKDKTVINAMREVALEYSDKITSKKF
jgi:PAS domain S-box-containing protein